MTHSHPSRTRPYDFHVRDGVAADADALSAVARDAKALWGYPEPWLEQWRPDLTISPEAVARMIVRVAVRGSAIIGFGAVERVDTGWELGHLWVDPAHGRRGVGTRLLSALADAARAAGAERLRIDADPHAVRFYERAGAVQVGRVPAPMPGAEERTLVVMALRIAD